MTATARAPGTAISLTGFLVLLVLLGSTVVAALSLVTRFRRASGELRQQLKWFGCSATLVALAVASSPLTPRPLNAVLISLPMTGVVVATAIAMLRYRPTRST